MNRSKTLEVMARAICGPPGAPCEACRLSAERALIALQAEGMAVVPAGPPKEGVANYADIALQDAMEEIVDNGHKIFVYRDDLFLKSMEGNGFRIFPASPYGKAGKEKDDE